MDERTRVALVVAATVGLFVLVQLGALALAGPFETTYEPVEDPQNPTNSLVYVGFILLATAGMLVVIRLGAQRLIRWVIVGVGAMLAWYVLDVVAWLALSPLLPEATAARATAAVAVAGALGVAVGLVVHPEWYVIDAAGVVMGAGAAGLFGISFGILPALVLLVVLAVYDAISVYGTEHMLALAEGVMELKIPVLLVVPTTLSFSMDDLVDEQGETGDEEATDQGGEAADGIGAATGAEGDATGGPAREAERGPFQRDALFIGLGDAVIPTVLVASAGVFLDAPSLVPGLALNVPALGGMLGTLAGLLGLLYFVLKGRPHAGLPLLNGGTILGYLVAATAVGVPLSTALGL